MEQNFQRKLKSFQNANVEIYITQTEFCMYMALKQDLINMLIIPYVILNTYDKRALFYLAKTRRLRRQIMSYIPRSFC